MTAQPQAAPAANSLALAGFILGIATVVGVLLRPHWLLVDALGILAVVFGFIGLATANRSGGTRRQIAIWAIVLGFSPLVPLLLVTTTGFDYY